MAAELTHNIGRNQSEQGAIFDGIVHRAAVCVEKGLLILHIGHFMANISTLIHFNVENNNHFRHNI